MKQPIPSDWNGEDWLCLQLEWPNSPEWVGLLNGILTLLTRGRYWDERTGTITEVQQIAREIFDRAYPYRECVEVPPTNGNGADPPVSHSGGPSTEESEDEMPAVTWLEAIDGILYMYFGPCCKIAVEGNIVSVIDPPPDNPGEDEGEPPTWACNKAAGIAEALFTLMVDVRDAISGVGTVYQMYGPAHQVLSPHNSTWQTTRAVCHAYADDTSGIDTLLADPDTEEWMACTWAAVFVNTDTISADEYWSMQIANYPTFTDAQKLFLATMIHAAGIQTIQWWARLFHDNAATCDCPGLPGFGALQWTDYVEELTSLPNAQDGVMTSALSVGNSVLDVNWTGTSSVGSTDNTTWFGVATIEPVTEVVLKLQGPTMPTLTWDPTCPPQVMSNVNHGDFNIAHDTLTFEYGADYVLATFGWTVPKYLTRWGYHTGGGARHCPQSPGHPFDNDWTVTIVSAS